MEHGKLKQSIFTSHVKLLARRILSVIVKSSIGTRGLIYKTVRGIVTKVYVRPKAKFCLRQKIFRLIKPCVRTPLSNLCFINHRVPTSVRSWISFTFRPVHGTPLFNHKWSMDTTSWMRSAYKTDSDARIMSCRRLTWRHLWVRWRPEK